MLRRPRALASFCFAALLAVSCSDDPVPGIADRAVESARDATANPMDDAAPAFDDAANSIFDDAANSTFDDAGPTDDAAPVLDDAAAPGFDDAAASAFDDAGPTDDAAAPSADAAGASPDAAIPGGGDASTSPDAGPNPNSNTSDFDCDGLSDAEEVMLGTDPALTDTDRDGLSDGLELGRQTIIVGTTCVFAGDTNPATTTDPRVADTDGDRVIDGNEDRDHDGAVGATETNPRVADTDGDGLADGVEDADLSGAQDPGETNATVADTDGDGLSDGAEDRNRNGRRDMGETSPLFADTDFDGISDRVEDANGNGMVDANESNPTLFDSDGDGLRDGCEDRNQNGVQDPGEPSPRATDSDLDGIEDGDEDLNGNCALDATETDPGSSDTDCDGLSDLVEISSVYAGGRRTNPRVVDTDADLISDGIEAGARVIVPRSACAMVAFDLDPPTHTNPTVADTDLDGRADGCEDRNRNGRVDPGEMNPLALDTDGDGIRDNVEDANGNCIADASETSAVNGDTDGDGIGDNVEITLGTNPRLADTDGDGLPDGLEDANQNGIVDPGETNPRNRDTDGDTIADGAEDANRNGTVDAGETDPRRADTDGDGVNDNTEVTNGTNPRLADTDGDGLNDGAEATAGTNPLNPDSDADGITDGDEVIAGTNPRNANDPGPQGTSGINAICSPANLQAIQFNNGVAGNWEMALLPSYTYTPLTVAGGTDFAAAFNDSALGVSGFVANIAPPVAGTNPTTQAQALIGRLTAGAATLGATSVTLVNNGRQIVSADGFGTVVEIRAAVTLAVATDPNTLRARVLAVLSAHTVAQITGLPAAGGTTSTQFIVRFASLVRTGTTRIVMHGAVATDANFNNAATAHRFQVEDLSNGTALARAFATNATGCDQFLANRVPSADILFMADTSGSTDNDRGTIATASTLLFNGLTANGIDFRVGVVPHQSNRVNLGAGNGGVMRSNFTRTQATFIADLNNTAGNNGCEFGLTAIDDAIVRATPRTAAGAPEVATRLRATAQLVIFYISDEHAQEVEENTCGLGNLGTGQADGSRTTPSAAQTTAINTIVQPFINRLVANSAIAFGQLTPLQSPFCTDNEDGQGYFQAITQGGGTFYRTCDASPGTVLTDIVDAVSGAASQFVLAETPISASLKVGITRAGSTMTTVVPRSTTSGFAYDAAANTIFFRGAAFRPAIGDRITVSYRVYRAVVPPVTCAPPLVLNPITGACDCPSNCGTGCGLGEICDRNPAVCDCLCEPDCGGRCGGSTTCDQNTCACVCAPNCGGTCAGGQVCNQATCACACPANCGGACTGAQVCDQNACACTCPTNCGGTCGSNQVCDPVSCSCRNGSN